MVKSTIQWIIICSAFFYVNSFICDFIRVDVHGISISIVRPVKRDWAVLSKDTPVDISI